MDTNTPHILKTIDTKSAEYDEAETAASTAQWLVDSFSKGSCKRVKTFGLRETKCTCMRSLFGADEEAGILLASKVAKYILFWKNTNTETKRGIIHGLHANANLIIAQQTEIHKNPAVYLLPVIDKNL